MSAKEAVIIEAPIVQQVIIESRNKSKARCKAVLQTLGVPGHNGRKYIKEVVESELQRKRSLMEQRSFLGELDHPITDDPIRNSIVLLEKASHVILETYIDDNKVHGILETLSNTPGRELYNLAVVDQIPVGFSLRALGSTRYDSGVQLVTRMTMVSYDAVSNPSFSEARIKELNIAEIASKIEKDTPQPLLEMKQPMVCIGNKCYLVEHIDRVLSESVRKAIDKILWGF